jgi:hypothetical protein
MASAPVLPAAQSVQYTTRPSPGLETLSISARVILGGRNPLFADFTSSMAELCGWEPSVVIATWARVLINTNITAIADKRISFMIRYLIHKQLCKKCK